MTTITTASCPTLIQGVVGSGSYGCSFLLLVVFCLLFLCGTKRELQSSSMEEYLQEAITLRQTFHGLYI